MRFDTRLLARIDAAARQQGISRTAWLRPMMIAGQRYWRRGDILAFVESQSRSYNPPPHENGAKPATDAPAALSPADGDALGQRSQPFGG
jgi:hypothetical protein